MQKKIGLYFSKRKIFYIFTGSCFFILLSALSFFYFKVDQLNKLEEKIERVFSFSQTTLKKRMERTAFLKKYVDADVKNFQEKVESLKFLSNEMHLLDSLQKHSAYNQNPTVINRAELIKNNRLLFEDVLSRKSTLIKETEKKQVRSIEINQDDLTNLLSLFEKESSSMKKPQVFFKKFHLSLTPQGTFLIKNMEIIQREFQKKQ